MKIKDIDAAILDLCTTLTSIDKVKEMHDFLKDLCTPQEIEALSERWKVCKLLAKGDLSYREIHSITGTSLTTIGRIARFLKNEPNNGYANVLKKEDLC